MGYKKPRIGKHTFRVGKSTAGLGLFATDEIKRGDFLIEYYGPIISTEESDKKGGRYMFKIDKDWTINGAVRYNTARYINHSCKPNAFVEQDGRRMFIYAKKNIHLGEEIGYNYGKEYWEDLIGPSKCMCDHCLSKRPRRKRSN